MFSWLAKSDIMCQRLLDQAEADAVEAEAAKADSAPAGPKSTTKVLADGTYATETIYSAPSNAAKLEAVKAASKPPLRCTSCPKLRENCA